MTEETPTLAPEPTLLVAIGNPLRGDDGVAAEFARQVAAMFKQEAARGVAMRPPWRILEVHPLCPEHAASIACFGEVIFVDADPATLEPKLQQLCSSGG
ncbi:MAG: hypothetical protein U5J83_02470 [Bryobacterales bacterium]|nr:hypothetical protein [Bryobacterales bacterium]